MSDVIQDLSTVKDNLSNLPEGVNGGWYLWDQGNIGHRSVVRRLDDRRYVAVMPLMFTHAIIWGYIGDTFGYEDRWCYHDKGVAIAAATAWDGTGEPEGWHRHPATGRRRPDGDPSQEYVNK